MSSKVLFPIAFAFPWTKGLKFEASLLFAVGRTIDVSGHPMLLIQYDMSISVTFLNCTTNTL